MQVRGRLQHFEDRFEFERSKHWATFHVYAVRHFALGEEDSKAAKLRANHLELLHLLLHQELDRNHHHYVPSAIAYQLHAAK